MQSWAPLVVVFHLRGPLVPAVRSTGFYQTLTVLACAECPLTGSLLALGQAKAAAESKFALVCVEIGHSFVEFALKFVELAPAVAEFPLELVLSFGELVQAFVHGFVQLASVFGETCSS